MIQALNRVCLQLIDLFRLVLRCKYVIWRNHEREYIEQFLVQFDLGRVSTDFWFIQ